MIVGQRLIAKDDLEVAATIELLCVVLCCPVPLLTLLCRSVGDTYHHFCGQCCRPRVEAGDGHDCHSAGLLLTLIYVDVSRLQAEQGRRQTEHDGLLAC